MTMKHSFPIKRSIKRGLFHNEIVQINLDIRRAIPKRQGYFKGTD